MHKNRKIRYLFKRVLRAVPRSAILSKFRKSSIRKEQVFFFKYFGGISAKKEKKRHTASFIIVGKESF